MNTSEVIIASLDLGSSLTKVVVGRVSQDLSIEIIGLGTAPSTGIKTGGVINLEVAIRSILDAVGDAELMAGLDIDSVIVNISGKSIFALNAKGVVAVTNKNRTVSEPDVIRVVESAQAVKLPSDHEILHVLSKDFTVDDQTGIKDPIGMTGIRLECEVHIVTAAKTALNNLDRCLETSGLKMIDRVLSSLASSEAVITTGEKELGAGVLDIGAGVSDLILFTDGGVAYSSVIPLGGFHITNDISMGLKTPVEAAEIIKKRHGQAMERNIDPSEKIEVPAISGRPARTVSREELARIIEPRMREIFELVDDELKKSGRKQSLAGGLILTGGGSLLEGIEELCEDVTGISAGRAKPAGLTGLAEKVSSPEFSTAVGLIKYAARLFTREDRQFGARQDKSGWTSRLKRWMEENL